jgi:hypothetical protein
LKAQDTVKKELLKHAINRVDEEEGAALGLFIVFNIKHSCYAETSPTKIRRLLAAGRDDLFAVATTSNYKNDSEADEHRFDALVIVSTINLVMMNKTRQKMTRQH